MTEQLDKYLFEPAATISVAIRGSSARYPVNRIFCVGRNYVAHAEEMGVQPDKAEPFYFTKTPNTIVPSGATIPYPPATKNYHYEMELVIAMGAPAFETSKEDALDAVYGYASGLDMTRRDLQLIAREKSRPWDLGKDFEQSAIISNIVPATEIGHPSQGAINLSVNGEVKQSADLSQLINNTAEIIAHLSQFYHLTAGDLIYTGTPAGVGPVVAGDKLTGYIDGVGEISLSIE